MPKNKAPLYMAVKTGLYDILNDDKYTPGQWLPSEMQLAEQLGVSRMTVRQALAEIEAEGFIRRSQGRGTQLLRKPFKIDLPLDKVGRLADLLGPGVRLETTSLTIEEQPAGELVAQKLQLPLGAPVVEYRRVRTIEGIPAIFTVDYLAKQRIPGRIDYQSAAHSLTQAMGVEVLYSNTKILPCEVGAEVGRTLSVPPATLCLMAVELGCLPSGLPVNYANEYYLSSCFNFLVIRHKL